MLKNERIRFFREKSMTFQSSSAILRFHYFIASLLNLIWNKEKHIFLNQMTTDLKPEDILHIIFLY